MAPTVAFVILLGALAMAFQSVGYLTTPVATSPGILPLIVSIAAAAIAALLLVLEFIRGDISLARFQSAWGSAAFRQQAARAAGWLSLAAIYAIATPAVGFTWATVAFLGIALTVFARLAWWRTAIIAVAMATLIPIAFRYLFFTIVP